MNTDIIYRAANHLKGLLDPDCTSQLARETGFVQRSSRKMNPVAFLLVFVVDLSFKGTHSLEAICDLLAGQNGGVRMTAQALSQRLGEVKSVRFLKRCFSEALSRNVRATASDPVVRGIIGRFTNVFIEDSSSSELHAAVAGTYKAAGGSASKAGYKVHAIWNAMTCAVASLTITAAAVADQAMVKGILHVLSRGSLVIRDLGYFTIPSFKAIKDAEAYFLSRLKSGINVYTPDGVLIEDLAKYFRKCLHRGSPVDIEVLIGAKEKFPVRLVAGRVPDAVFNQRMRKRNRKAQKNGRTVSKAARNFARFTVFVTNVESNLLKAEEFPVLYKLRWEIELIFKTYKSRMQIHIIPGKSQARIECYIIARLIAIMAIAMMFSRLTQYTALRFDRELSLDKVTAWILRHRYLVIIFCPERMTGVLTFVDTDILPLCKQKRSRKTTRELLGAGATAKDVYPPKNEGHQ